MGGALSYSSHTQASSNSSSFKRFGDTVNIQIISRTIIQGVMFVPLIIILVFNTKRSAEVSEEDTKDFESFSDYQDHAASLSFKYDPNIYE